MWWGDKKDKQNIWYFQESKKWKQYSNADSHTLCGLYRQKVPFVNLGKFTVDFREMMQRSNQTGFTRKVKCFMALVPGGKPEQLKRLLSTETTNPNEPAFGGVKTTSGYTAGPGGYTAGPGGHNAGPGGYNTGTGGGYNAGTGGHNVGTGGYNAGTGGHNAGTGGYHAGSPANKVCV